MLMQEGKELIMVNMHMLHPMMLVLLLLNQKYLK